MGCFFKLNKLLYFFLDYDLFLLYYQKLLIITNNKLYMLHISNFDEEMLESSKLYFKIHHQFSDFDCRDFVKTCIISINKNEGQKLIKVLLDYFFRFNEDNI